MGLINTIQETYQIVTGRIQTRNIRDIRINNEGQLHISRTGDGTLEYEVFVSSDALAAALGKEGDEFKRWAVHEAGLEFVLYGKKQTMYIPRTSETRYMQLVKPESYCTVKLSEDGMKVLRDISIYLTALLDGRESTEEFYDEIDPNGLLRQKIGGILDMNARRNQKAVGEVKEALPDEVIPQLNFVHELLSIRRKTIDEEGEIQVETLAEIINKLLS